MPVFPTSRLRRLRKTEKLRDLVQEVSLSPKDLICPVFVEEGIQAKKQVNSMPAIERLPLSEVVNEVDAIVGLGIPGIMLFGIPENKDDDGTSAYVEHGIVQKAISEIRKNFGEIKDIYPLADKITLLTALCLSCKDGTEAIFSKKITNKKEQIDVGNEDTYIPVCRKCYNNNLSTL